METVTIEKSKLTAAMGMIDDITRDVHELQAENNHLHNVNERLIQELSECQGRLIEENEYLKEQLRAIADEDEVLGI